jgi:hypothetical protein
LNSEEFNNIVGGAHHRMLFRAVHISRIMSGKDTTAFGGIQNSSDRGPIQISESIHQDRSLPHIFVLLANSAPKCNKFCLDIFDLVDDRTSLGPSSAD